MSVAAALIVLSVRGLATNGVLAWLALFPPLPFFVFGIQGGLLGSALFTVLVLAALSATVVIGGASGHAWLAVVNAGGALMLSTALTYLCEQHRTASEGRLIIAANTDPLTGVANRRGFLAGFECRRAVSERAGHALSLLVFDVDHLKRINDQYGHHIGDTAICHVAAVVRNLVREQDVLGRLGGDEFALLLPNTRIDSALRVAAKLRAILRSQPLCIAGHRIPLTVSIGAAAAPPGHADFDALFAAADEQLYGVKQNGRDHHVGLVVNEQHHVTA